MCRWRWWMISQWHPVQTSSYWPAGHYRKKPTREDDTLWSSMVHFSLRDMWQAVLKQAWMEKEIVYQRKKYLFWPELKFKMIENVFASIREDNSPSKKSNQTSSIQQFKVFWKDLCWYTAPSMKLNESCMNSQKFNTRASPPGSDHWHLEDCRVFQEKARELDDWSTARSEDCHWK